jgi:GTPase SAR1 family protein
MWRDFFRRRQPILILGATGVGKTSFVRTLQYGQAYPLSPLDRTHFASWHKIDAGGGHFLLQDTPSTVAFDADRFPHYLEDYLPELGTKGFGIINVVAYGYHEFLHTPQNVALDASGSIKPDFLEERRQIEIRLTEQWAKKLKPTWLITIVNKADL